MLNISIKTLFEKAQHHWPPIVDLRLLATIRQQVRVLSQSGYRPEKHYMRGPGPKSRQSAAALSRQTQSLAL